MVPSLAQNFFDTLANHLGRLYARFRLWAREHAQFPGLPPGGVAVELTGVRDGIVQGARLLYDGLPVHLLGKGALFRATCAHLTRPCIAGAHELLSRLDEAAGVDMTALRCSKPALMQRLDCLAASVQDEVCRCGPSTSAVFTAIDSLV